MHADLRWVWSGYFQLHAGRECGAMGGAQPISPADVLAWLEIHLVTQARRRAEFYDLVVAMDAEFLKHAVESRPKG